MPGIDGIEVNLQNNAGDTPLDILVLEHAAMPEDETIVSFAEMIRDKGGRCINQSSPIICGDG